MILLQNRTFVRARGYIFIFKKFEGGDKILHFGSIVMGAFTLLEIVIIFMTGVLAELFHSIVTFADCCGGVGSDERV